MTIPRLDTARKQRLYYPVNLKRFVKLLWLFSIANLILLLASLYLFFMRAPTVYYATTLAGKNIQIQAQGKSDAINVTMAHQHDS